MVFRSAMKQADVTIVGVNDPLEVDHCLLTKVRLCTRVLYDGTVEVDGGDLIVDGQRVKISAERNPADIGWGDLGLML